MKTEQDPKVNEVTEDQNVETVRSIRPSIRAIRPEDTLPEMTRTQIRRFWKLLHWGKEAAMTGIRRREAAGLIAATPKATQDGPWAHIHLKENRADVEVFPITPLEGEIVVPLDAALTQLEDLLNPPPPKRPESEKPPGVGAGHVLGSWARLMDEMAEQNGIHSILEFDPSENYIGRGVKIALVAPEPTEESSTWATPDEARAMAVDKTSHERLAGRNGMRLRRRKRHEIRAWGFWRDQTGIWKAEPSGRGRHGETMGHGVDYRFHMGPNMFGELADQIRRAIRQARILEIAEDADPQGNSDREGFICLVGRQNSELIETSWWFGLALSKAEASDLVAQNNDLLVTQRPGTNRGRVLTCLDLRGAAEFHNLLAWGHSEWLKEQEEQQGRNGHETECHGGEDWNPSRERFHRSENVG